MIYYYFFLTRNLYWLFFTDFKYYGTMIWHIVSKLVWQLFESTILIDTIGAVSNKDGNMKYWDGGTAPEKEAINVSLFP
jgi:hypothetical protein